MFVLSCCAVLCSCESSCAFLTKPGTPVCRLCRDHMICRDSRHAVHHLSRFGSASCLVVVALYLMKKVPRASGGFGGAYIAGHASGRLLSWGSVLESRSASRGQLPSQWSFPVFALRLLRAHSGWFVHTFRGCLGDLQVNASVCTISEGIQ